MMVFDMVHLQSLRWAYYKKPALTLREPGVNHW